MVNLISEIFTKVNLNRSGTALKIFLLVIIAYKVREKSDNVINFVKQNVLCKVMY